MRPRTSVCLVTRPSGIKLRGFRGLHRADSACGGEHAPLGIAADFRELTGRIVGVGGGNTSLIRLIQHAAAHPFGGGESSVAARFFSIRNGTLRSAPLCCARDSTSTLRNHRIKQKNR